jgi:opacity protein-like surface antigen
MKPFRSVRFLTLGVLLGVAPVSGLLAEDTKGKWQFGFGLSYFSTTDYIRSNADIALSQFVVGDQPGLPPVQSVDERPDLNVLNQPSIADQFKIDANVSYGLTRWLAVELSAGYLKAPVGSIEFYFKDQTNDIVGSGDTNTTNTRCGLTGDQKCVEFIGQVPFDVKENTFLPVGTITEIPIQLSAIARFRPESPLDPYLGLGIGYILTDLKTGDEFNERSKEIDDLPVVSTADKGDFTTAISRSSNCGPNFDQPCTNFSPGPITAKVDNAFQWHAVGGVDYFVNERVSWYVDARYVWTGGGVDIRTDGFPQVQLTIVDEGRLLLLRKGSPSQPFLWEDTGVRATTSTGQTVVYGAGDRLYATEDKFKGIQNTILEDQEDDGILLLLPPNTRDLAEAVDQYTLDEMGNRVLGEDGEPLGMDGVADFIFCPECAGNGLPDTEDKNGNTFMDTFLLYGVDICTFGTEGVVLDDGTRVTGVDNPKCRTANGNLNLNDLKNYVWPQGCAATAGQVTNNFQDLSVKANEGCPAFPAPGMQLPRSTTATDNAADVYIIQGGKIKLGGFSLGFGFKFLF